MPDIWGIATIVSKFVLYLSLFSVAGHLIVRMLFSAEVTTLGNGFRMKGVALATLALMMAMLHFALGGALLLDDVSGMYDLSILQLLWDTPPGEALFLRVVGISLLTFGLLIGGFAQWIGLLGAIIAISSFAIIGHIAGVSQLWLQAVLVVHLLVAAFWIGVLSPLRALARNETTLSYAASLGHRFGNLAAFAVPALLLAGGVMSWRLVGDVSSLFTTTYGQVLIFKIIIVCGLLSLAALNKVRFVPSLEDGAMTAGSGLARSIQFEWVCIWGIFLATAVFTSVLSLPG